MKQFTYTVTASEGLHARPASAVVKLAKSLQSSVSISNGERQADAKRMLSVMSLGAKKGSEIVVKAEGESEESDILLLKDFFRENI